MQGFMISETHPDQMIRVPAGNHSLEASENSIYYRPNFTHILLYEQSMPLCDVAYATSGFVPGGPGMLTISRTGYRLWTICY